MDKILTGLQVLQEKIKNCNDETVLSKIKANIQVMNLILDNPESTNIITDIISNTWVSAATYNHNYYIQNIIRHLFLSCDKGKILVIKNKELSQHLKAVNYEDDWQAVEEHAPYDTVVIYDVLDHCENPHVYLSKIRKLCHKSTIIKIRFHPWFSRHAIHQHHILNKAFINLFLNEKQLETLGFGKIVNAKVESIFNYMGWVVGNGFKIVYTHEITQPIETILTSNPLFTDRVEIEKSNLCFFDVFATPV